MKAAILHYHLHPGGVTRVIESAALALSRLNVRTVVLAGAPATKPGSLPGMHRTISCLDYHDSTQPLHSPVELADMLEREAAAALDGAPEVWHIHNHSLGKNPLYTQAACVLAGRGRRLLLQIHDFAEDFRPAQMRLLQQTAQASKQSLAGCLYPDASHIHYAVLNRRDFDVLEKAGLPPGRLHSLPNPVAPPEGDTEGDNAPEHPPLLLYPVRAIRRKNIGELLFLSALALRGERFAVTLAPKNPEERPIYEAWVAFAAKHGLPVEFDFGPRSGKSLAALQQSAAAVITTSVAEGFGLAFLEAWLAGRPVMGRNLPEITADFSDAGVDISGLYDRLLLPLEWIGADSFRVRVAQAYSALLKEYGRSSTPEDAEQAWRAACVGERVDMGRLSEDFQALAIQRILESPADAAAVEPQLPDVTNLPAEKTARNQDAILNTFSLEAYGRRLMSLYEAVAASETGSPLENLNAESILDSFLAPERFTMLRGVR